jgi:RHS repeat-associated protein
LFTGEQLDTETDNYFLRARYYSPNSARFISRDTYDGENIDPITLNHYLYAGSNPSMYVDPSGNTYSMSGLSFSMATLGALSAVALPKLPSIGGLAGGFVDNLVDAARVGSTMSLSAMTYVYVMARLRSRSASEDDSPNHTPIQVYGSNNLPRHQEHIADAIAGFGSNWGSPAPSKLRRVTPEINNRNFLSWIGVCGGSPRPKGRNGEDQHCDEYPYNSTSDGGTPAYILGKVSVRLVPADESRAQGRFISKFYNNSVDYGDSFFVMPIGGGVSGFYDKRGMWHDFN